MFTIVHHISVVTQCIVYNVNMYIYIYIYIYMCNYFVMWCTYHMPCTI